MTTNFFANYKDFIILPLEEKVNITEFKPQDFVTHYILTLSLNESLISCWKEANKYELDIKQSIEDVLADFNRNQNGLYFLQVLELDEDKSYFVLSLSCKYAFESDEVNKRISYIIEKLLSNPFYVGQSWFRLIGEKGRIRRKLFCFSYREYTF
jgi:hypothetical protein